MKNKMTSSRAFTRNFIPKPYISAKYVSLPLISSLLMMNSLPLQAGEPDQGNERMSERPNIIFIMADDLGYGDLGCYGQEKINTPQLDEMAEEGMRFTDFYAGSTVCAPSRCALLTGKHTGHAIVRGNASYERIYEETTVANILQEAGYTTGMFGKWGFGQEAAPVGFDEFYGYDTHRAAHYYYPEILWHNGEQVEIPENKNGKQQVYSHDLFTERALDFIEEENKEEDPFFLYLPYTIPHAEILAPDESKDDYLGKFPEEAYKPNVDHQYGHGYAPQPEPNATRAGMITRMDRDIGRIMDLLSKLNIEKNTIVFFTSDNGPCYAGGQNPRFFIANGPLRGLKFELFEGGIRVPLIVKWPGKIPANTMQREPFAFWDFLPTAADLAGVEPPANTDGISFLPLLMNKEQKLHDYLYWEFSNMQAIRFGGSSRVPLKWKALRLNLENNPDAPVMLFNLRNDISERCDVSGQYPELAEKAKKLMEQARTESEIYPLMGER